MSHPAQNPYPTAPEGYGTPYPQAPYGQPQPNGYPDAAYSAPGYGGAPYPQAAHAQGPYPQPSYPQPNYPVNPTGMPAQGAVAPYAVYGQGQSGSAWFPPADGSAKALAAFAHGSGLLAAFFTFGLLAPVAPAVIWAFTKDSHPLVRRSAASAFNFNLSALILGFCLFLCAITIVGLVIAIPAGIAAGLVYLIATVVGIVKAVNGEVYEYPFQLKVLN